MLSVVRLYTPDTWDASLDQKDVYSFSEEFRQISNEVKQATSPDLQISRMIRVQDLHSYGQFLIREQLLLHSNTEPLFRVRRFITVDFQYLNAVIKYNLDPRRCGLGRSLYLKDHIGCAQYDRLIVIVKVLTTDSTKSVIQPDTSCDCYVEYVIVQK